MSTDQNSGNIHGVHGEDTQQYCKDRLDRGKDAVRQSNVLSCIYGRSSRLRYHISSIRLAVSKLKNDVNFRKQAEIFITSGQEVDKATESGEKALVELVTTTMKDWKFLGFCDKVIKGNVHVGPQALPPTLAAAKYLSLRV